MISNIIKACKKNESLKLMTHVVAGYPNLKISREIVHLMVECGVDLIEIQIPFSDPLADGPTITAANQKALDAGIKVKDSFELIRNLKGIPVPLLLMSYINIPFRMGIDRFLSEAKSAGADGVILPDIPFDEVEGDFISGCIKMDLAPIQVISPDISEARLKIISKRAQGFIYTTLKIGTTGAKERIASYGIKYLGKIKKFSTLPIAAGFGISSAVHLNQLKGRAEIAVIGSKVIDLYNEKGLGGVKEFLKASREVCDT